MIGLITHGSVPQPSSHVVGLSSMASLHYESSHDINYLGAYRDPPREHKPTKCGPWGPPGMTKTRLSLRKLQGVSSYLPGLRDKVQATSLLYMKCPPKCALLKRKKSSYWDLSRSREYRHILLWFGCDWTVPAKTHVEIGSPVWWWWEVGPCGRGVWGMETDPS